MTRANLPKMLARTTSRPCLQLGDPAGVIITLDTLRPPAAGRRLLD